MEDMSSSEVKSWLSSAEEIGSNQDILTEILVRVPAKPLLKFKCVSKQWLSLISDPKFCISHTRCQHILNNTPSALLLCNGYTSTPEFQVVPLKDSTKVPFLDYLNVPRIRIQQSCNGLLLCESTKLLKPGKQKGELDETEAAMKFIPKPLKPWEDYYSSVVDDDDCGYRYFICNPTTKQFKRLVFPSYIHEGSDPFGAWLSLAFDPLKSPYYKVISMRFLNVYPGEYEIYIYSSETELWNQTRITFQAPLGMITCAGVFLNGAIHWSCKSQTSLYFDVDSETLKTMPMPLPPIPVSNGDEVRMWNILYFGESRGHLHIVVSKYNSFLPLEKFDVLEMAADYSGWFVRYHVDLYSVRAFGLGVTLHPREDLVRYNEDLCYLRTRLMEITPLSSKISVLGIIQADKEEESMVVLYLEVGGVISYNPCNGTLNKLNDLESRPTPDSFGNELDYIDYDAYQYFHTLFPICE